VGVCINYTGVNFVGSESSLKLYHYENETWVNRTVSRDTVNDIICADVTSLSPFLILEPAATDVTAMSQLNQFGTRFDRRTGQLSVMATWTNIGADALSQPLQMVVDSVTPSTITVANADGTTDDGKPFYDFSNSAGDGKLDATETSAAKQLIFNNPTRVRFTFDVRFLAVAEGNNVGAAPPLRTLIEPPQTVDVDPPLVSALEQNYPNPFNPETWIPYELADASFVTITIYDAQGWLVRMLDLGHRDVGRYLTKERAAYWDGRNNLGERVVSGVYFYQIRAGDFQSTRKMIVLK